MEKVNKSDLQSAQIDWKKYFEEMEADDYLASMEAHEV